MKFVFDINPSAFTSGEAVFALILAAVIFIVVPVVLAILEYRMTKKDRKNGTYLMIGVFASTVLLGFYSLLVGGLLLIVFFAASPKNTTEIDNETEQA